MKTAKMTLKTLSLLTLLSVSGCQSVPQTDIKYDPHTGKLHIQSPKQVYAEGILAVITNGATHVSIQKISATNDMNLVLGVAAANIKMTQQILDGTIAILQAAGALKP